MGRYDTSRTKLVYTKIQISHETWKKINSQKEPNETMDDTIKRLLEDRDRFKTMALGLGEK